MKSDSGKFTIDDLEIAVGDLSTIPFFPSDERARASVMEQLRRMCPHIEGLRFIVDTAMARCKQWPGMSELRGLLCTRYNAADGIDEPNCSIPGFTAEEAEAKFLAAHESVKAQSQLPVPELAVVRQIAAGKSMEATKGELNQLERLGRDLGSKLHPKLKPAEFAYSSEQIAQLETDMANEQLPYAARQVAAQMLDRCLRGTATEAKA
jgi:hypothetical protein